MYRVVTTYKSGQRETFLTEDSVEVFNVVQQFEAGKLDFLDKLVVERYTLNNVKVYRPDEPVEERTF